MAHLLDRFWQRSSEARLEVDGVHGDSLLSGLSNDGLNQMSLLKDVLTV
jgi:hypothetical protein